MQNANFHCVKPVGPHKLQNNALMRLESGSFLFLCVVLFCEGHINSLNSSLSSTSMAVVGNQTSMSDNRFGHKEKHL